jgi:hypothetical protein
MLPRHRLCRLGYSLLELQVAFVVLAIALAGLYPLVVIHLKQQRTLEQRLDPQTTYYLVPSTDAWARKLGCAALFRTQDPGPPPPRPSSSWTTAIRPIVKRAVTGTPRHRTRLIMGPIAGTLRGRG